VATGSVFILISITCGMAVLVDLEKKRYILGGLLKFAEVPYRD
jgi:hypothetical protein